jgi:adenine deaminase
VEQLSSEMKKFSFITNVLYLVEIDLINKISDQIMFQLNYITPSCLPTTPFETTGADITANNIEDFY